MSAIECDVEIPEGAMPVVEVLRRDVKRPTAKLIEGSHGQARFECGKCPMGLHPTALRLTPAVPQGFLPNSELGQLQIAQNCEEAAPGYYFWTWWDRLTLDEARKAVDLIWPEED